MNIHESIKNSTLDITKLTDKIPRAIFNLVVIDSTTFFCKEPDNTITQQIRSIVKDANKTIPPILQKLNDARLRPNEDINIITTITKQNVDNGIFIEMPARLNYLNMYLLDSSFCKTICVGKRLDDIEKIQDIERDSRIFNFSDIRMFNDFWSVLYVNEEDGAYYFSHEKRKNHPAILLFDWQGEPLAEIKLDRFITTFDIDFINGKLYTLDYTSDEFYVYDIKDILAKIK